jgi:hypothetical protein
MSQESVPAIRLMEGAMTGTTRNIFDQPSF